MFGSGVPDLSLDAFVEWLSERSEMRVGLLGSWLCSPLVAWLSDVYGSACWINHQCFGLDILPLQVSLPDWARLFLVQTECYGGFVEATGLQVFDILAGIESRSLCVFEEVA